MLTSMAWKEPPSPTKNNPRTRYWKIKNINPEEGEEIGILKF
jgi:hypothetical protein